MEEERPGLNYEIVDFHSGWGQTMKGMGGVQLRLGWTPPIPFEDSLKKTIEVGPPIGDSDGFLWYLKDENKHWLGL